MSSATPYFDDSEPNPFEETPPFENATPVEENGPVITTPQIKTSTLPEYKFMLNHTMSIQVTSIERVGSLTNKRDNPTVYLTYDTTIPYYRTSTRQIKKTVMEINNLQKFITGQLIECWCPSLPPTWSHYGINNEEDRDVVISWLQEWFNRICEDSIIVSHEEFMIFLESDFNSYNWDGEMIRYDGIRRKTMKQFQPPYDSNNFLAEFRPLVKSVYLNVKRIKENMDRNVLCDGLLINYETSLGKQYIEMGHEDNNTTPFNTFGKMLITLNDLNSCVDTMNMATLYDGLTWIERDSYNVKESLTDRHFLMRDVMNAQTQNKALQERARKYRNKRDVDKLKLHDSIHDLQVSVKHEGELTHRLERVTENMELSLTRWCNWYEEWVKQCVKNYTLRQLEYQRRKLAVLERTRHTLRTLGQDGGLSRLGREHLEKHASSSSNTTTTTKPNPAPNHTHITALTPQTAVQLLGRADFS